MFPLSAGLYIHCKRDAEHVMSEELGTRDVVEQLDTRLSNLEQGQRDLRAEVVTRFARVDSRFDELRSEMTSGFDQLRGEMTSGFGQLRCEMDRRLGRLNGMMVTLLLGLVVGVGGLWLK